MAASKRYTTRPNIASGGPGRRPEEKVIVTFSTQVLGLGV